MIRAAPLIVAGLALARAAPEADLVEQLPDFDVAPFAVCVLTWIGVRAITQTTKPGCRGAVPSVHRPTPNHPWFGRYSGYLTVPGPFELNPYDSLSIHYQFHASQSDAASDPVVTWHQGGPGGSSIYGLYGEMGYFQTDSTGAHANPYAWNNRANMLYLESPAGSNFEQAGTGYSTCVIDGAAQKLCKWDDVSQAEAYGHTLQAFFKAFPELASNDLYLTGESYAGQYVPNIANWILTESEGALDTPLNLKGIAVGNACWGGTEDEVCVWCVGWGTLTLMQLSRTATDLDRREERPPP